MHKNDCSEKCGFCGVLRPAEKHLMENSLRSDLSIGELAEECSISEVYFRKLFVKQFGMSPKQYVISIRIEKAKMLLFRGDIQS